MVIPFVRANRFFRAFVLTVAVFSFLLWFYIILRIVFNRVSLSAPFIVGIPGVTFVGLGAFSFGVSFVFTFLYLWIWARFDRTPVYPPWYQQRGP